MHGELVEEEPTRAEIREGVIGPGDMFDRHRPGPDRVAHLPLRLQHQDRVARLRRREPERDMPMGRPNPGQVAAQIGPLRMRRDARLRLDLRQSLRHRQRSGTPVEDLAHGDLHRAEEAGPALSCEQSPPLARIEHRLRVVVVVLDRLDVGIVERHPFAPEERQRIQQQRFDECRIPRLGRRLERGVRSRAQAEEDDPRRPLVLLEPHHHPLDVAEQRVGVDGIVECGIARRAVAEPLDVHANAAEACLREPASDIDVEPIRPDMVDRAGVEQQNQRPLRINVLGRFAEDAEQFRLAGNDARPLGDCFPKSGRGLSTRLCGGGSG